MKNIILAVVKLAFENNCYNISNELADAIAEARLNGRCNFVTKEGFDALDDAGVEDGSHHIVSEALINEMKESLAFDLNSAQYGDEDEDCVAYYTWNRHIESEFYDIKKAI